MENSMENAIDISSILPIGMNKEQATKLALNIAKTMKVMWSAKGGPIKLNPKDFAYTAVNYCGVPESKRLIADRIQLVFSENALKEIINSKNEFITFTFDGEGITVNSKSPQPA